MRDVINPLINALYSGQVVQKGFLRQYFKDETPSERHILYLIEQAVAKQDGAIVEEVVVLLYTDCFNINSLLTPLCQLLKEYWDTKHEDIVMLIKGMKSPLTVDCLYESAELKFEYLDYDDTYQFARKCIKALSDIGDENAIAKLKLLAAGKTTEIAEYAKKELRYKGLL